MTAMNSGYLLALECLGILSAAVCIMTLAYGVVYVIQMLVAM